MRPLAVIAALMTPGFAFADCATDAEIAAFVASVTANEPAIALSADGSIEDALCTQAKLAIAMEPTMGPVIGYKAGLTSTPAQERFGVTEPVQGLLYQNMMVQDGASVPVQFGAIPMVEADLVLVVGDDAINEAKTPGDVISNISAVHPFIELPDMTVAQGQPITAVTLTAIGVAPKLGVLGAALPVEDPAAMATALEEMIVTLRDGAGEVIVTAPGAAVLGNPANSVLWLMSKGITLQKGDLISVGSFGPLTPSAKMNGGASVTYSGLPGDPVVSVTFTQ
ncbi:MAG: 2-keto-4-pentenoate hydratase [Sulfitobacter sp.]